MKEIELHADRPVEVQQWVDLRFNILTPARLLVRVDLMAT